MAVTLPHRPHPLARSPRVERVNGWLESSWRKGWSSYPSLDPGDLWEKALRSAPASGEFGGRSEEDAADFRARLAILCQSLEAEARLNPLGRTCAHGQLVRIIRQRLHLGALWQRQPHLLKTQIAPPIIVVGQMRSGTTRVHRLLAADPAHASTRFCDSWNPLPRHPDLRPLWSGLSLALARWLNPWLDTIHPFGTTRADEELGWLAAALNHCAYEAQWRIPAFSHFSEGRDTAPVYREFARLFRTDSAFHRNTHRPRVMKVPQFAEDLPALLAQFPDARLVFTSRGDDEVANSSVSLLANQMAMQSDAVDLDWIKSEAARKIALRSNRMSDALRRIGGPVAHVDFSELDCDWQGVVCRIYNALDLAFTTEAKTAMAHEMQSSAVEAHHQHRPTCQKFAEA